MKYKQIFLIVSLLIFSFNLISATTTATFNFGSANTNTALTPTEGIVDSDSFIFWIKTNERAVCRYSTTQGLPYSVMEGLFDSNLETVHKKVFTSVSDGVWRYYVKCKDINTTRNEPDGTAELEAIVTVNAKIGALISLDSEILTDGKNKITLSTTKVPLETPDLSYSYNGINYEPIVLYGSGTSWSGYLIISKSAGEQTGLFKFEARDLENRLGSKIYSGETFEVDTISPSAVLTLESIGEYNQIKLEWYNEYDDIDSIEIYRSESPGVNIANHHDSIDPDEDNYYDTNVDKGKTYYYRIAAIDKAGNLGDLSKEVVATARIDNSNTNLGLSANLISLVDALLTELDLVSDDITDAKKFLEDKETSEQDLLKIIGYFDDISSPSTELSALKKEIENYKLQDLTKETLESKLSSSRVKLNIIKKKIPQEVNLLNSDSKEIKVSLEDIRLAILDYAPELSSSQIDKAVKYSQKLLEEYKLSITSEVSTFEAIYLDGSKKTSSIIKHYLNSELESSATSSIIIQLPSGLNSDIIEIKNMDYEEFSSGSFRFDTDTKKITYITSEKLENEILDEINIVLVVIPEENAAVTGYFLSSVSPSGSVGITILILFAMGLLVYFIVMKKKTEEESIGDFLKKANKVKKLREDGENIEAEKLYETLKIDYISLSDEQKKRVFNKISHLHKK